MRIAPLNTGFLVASIIGLLVSILYIPSLSLTWAFAFGIVFLAMFVAAFISMARTTPDNELLPRPVSPTIHARRLRIKKRKTTKKKVKTTKKRKTTKRKKR